MNSNPSQMVFLPIYVYPVTRLSAGSMFVYSTPLPPLNSNPASWVEMAMQGQSLVLNVLMDNREVILVIHNPILLAHLTSEGMRRAIEVYNSHLWMSTALQPPMNYTLPAIPFFHIPTWETPIMNNLQGLLPTMAPSFPPIYLNFQDINPLYHHWQMQGMNQGVGPFYPVMGLGGLMETAGAQIQGLAGSMETAGAQMSGLAGSMETTGAQMPGLAGSMETTGAQMPNNIASSFQGFSPHAGEPSGSA
ncbi:hypothetical protein P3S67_031383 [Capsicum chacoense]